MIVTLVLMLMSGDVVAVQVEQEACEKTIEAVRQGSRVTIRDDQGKHYEVERAQCVIDLIAAEQPTS